MGTGGGTFCKRVPGEAEVGGYALERFVHHPEARNGHEQAGSRQGRIKAVVRIRAGKKRAHAPGVVSEEEGGERGDAHVRQRHAPRRAAVVHLHCGNEMGEKVIESNLREIRHRNEGEKRRNWVAAGRESVRPDLATRRRDPWRRLSTARACTPSC